MYGAYLVAKPSIFPPSPMFMYTGADRSFTGAQIPFTILYAIFETRSWHKHITCHTKQMPNKINNLFWGGRSMLLCMKIYRSFVPKYFMKKNRLW